MFNKEEKAIHQKADWSARPLSQSMLDYAAHDSFFMINIAQSIVIEFEAKGKNEEL